MEIKDSYGYRHNLNYGIIGNCQSSALIYKDSSIDWCCLPKFDSPSIFAKIIDNSIGGFFKVETEGSFNVSQEYFKNTCILKTSFNNGFDEFYIIDYMPRYQNKKKSYYSPPEITRIIKHIKGNPKIRIVYENDEVGIHHSFVTFDDGNVEAVMAVYKYKDGKIISLETGATPMPK